MNDPRPYTADELARIQTALAERAPKFGSCPLCGTDNWAVAPGLVDLDLRSNLSSGKVIVGGPSYPNLVFICNRCGNTVLMNVFTLGLHDLFGLTPAEPAEVTPADVPGAPS